MPELLWSVVLLCSKGSAPLIPNGHTFKGDVSVDKLKSVFRIQHMPTWRIIHLLRSNRLRMDHTSYVKFHPKEAYEDFGIAINRTVNAIFVYASSECTKPFGTTFSCKLVPLRDGLDLLSDREARLLSEHICPDLLDIHLDRVDAAAEARRLHNAVWPWGAPK